MGPRAKRNLHTSSQGSQCFQIGLAIPEIIFRFQRKNKNKYNNSEIEKVLRLHRTCVGFHKRNVSCQRIEKAKRFIIIFVFIFSFREKGFRETI